MSKSFMSNDSVITAAPWGAEACCAHEGDGYAINFGFNPQMSQGD